MPNQWNKGDVLNLTADCELGNHGDIVRVTSVDGPYMTATVLHHTIDGSILSSKVIHTGRDYRFAIKVGTFEDDGEPLFSWADDELNACEAKLREVERRMREVPTARHCADRVAEVCARLEEIAEEFANADHMGNG